VPLFEWHHGYPSHIRIFHHRDEKDPKKMFSTKSLKGEGVEFYLPNMGLLQMGVNVSVKLFEAFTQCTTVGSILTNMKALLFHAQA